MIYECYNTEVGQEVAADLLKIKAIKLSPDKPFSWASGWKSPIYCDNRLSLSHPKVRTNITENFVQLIQDRFPDCEGISGVATAGIPQGVLVAEALDLPFSYVRSKSKSHGLSNQVEGKVKKGQKLVVLEDLVSTGGSSLAAISALRDKKVDIQGMVSIFTYGFPLSRHNFEKEQVDLYFLSEYSILISLAISNGLVKPELLDTLNEWREHPDRWTN